MTRDSSVPCPDSEEVLLKSRHAPAPTITPFAETQSEITSWPRTERMFTPDGGAWETPLCAVYATNFAISVWKSEHLSQKKGLNRGGSVWDQESGWKLWRAAPLPADRVPLSLKKECSLLSAKLAQRILECTPPWGVVGDRGQSLQSRSASLPLQHFSCPYPDEWDLISAPCVRRSFCLSAAVRSGRDLCSLVVRDCRKRVTRKAGAMVTRTRQKDLSEKPNIRKKNNNRI